MRRSAGWRALALNGVLVLAPYSVVLALGVAITTGMFSGIYPANRAASLEPIDALRYE